MLIYKVLFLIFLLTLSAPHHTEAAVCPDKAVTDCAVSRHFYHHIAGTNYYSEHNVTITSSPYTSLRLISELVKQLLSKKLGYHSVQYAEGQQRNVSNCTINFSEEIKLDSSKDRFKQGLKNPVSFYNNITSETCIELDWPPEPLIDIQPSAEKVKDGYTDAGSLGLSARYGLYMSSAMVDQVYKESKTIANSYASMSSDPVVSKFALYNDNITELFNRSRSSKKSVVCVDGEVCDGYTYAPTYCNSSSPCAILLVGNNDFPMTKLQDKIETLHLRLSILLVQENFATFVTDLSSSNVPVIFFSRSLDVLTTMMGSFLRVRSLEQPKCANFADDNDCHFPRMEFRKLIWSRLIKAEPLIYKLIKNIHMNDTMMMNMLRDYRSHSQLTVDRFVCLWMQAHSTLVMGWVPSGASQKPKLYIGGFFPLSQDRAWKDPSLVPAAQMAIERINNSGLLSEYELNLIVNDTQCDTSYVLETFTQYLVNKDIWSRMVGGLGPACSDTTLPVAALATHYNYVFISYAVEAMVLSLDRSRYKYFFRTIPPISEYAKVYIALFKKLGWDKFRVSMLTGDSMSDFPIYHRIMAEEFGEQGFELLRQDLPKKQYIRKEERPYAKYLDAIKEANSYIIIMDVHGEVARSVMCEAYRKKMTLQQGYHWFLRHSYEWDWYDPNSPTYSNEIPCNVTEMLKAVRGYFAFNHAKYDQTENVAVGGMTGKQFKREYQNEVKRKNVNIAGEHGSYTYDAVWAFAKALDALQKDNPAYLKYIHTASATERYVDKIYKTKFQGVSGMISFNKKGDRSGTVDIFQYNNTEEDDFLGETTVGFWSTDNFTLHTNRIEMGPGSAVPPLSTPPVHCEWETLRVAVGVESCSTALLVIVIPTCSLVIIVIIIGALVALKKAKRKYRLAAELASNYNDSRAYSTYLDLYAKEISRDHVVLNRKLGEGAFGTVYGGEAYINSMWTGVAVKTLQVGSNSEDKLDFLREADIMKRFDHPNIVKLLGVTTVGQPAYAIMEFMLYGDLKTYLLSRRELVNMETAETEDISAASLTRMAMDVSEGLHYLHTKECIHRDIACRNCMISSKKVVKIGDFGMARRVYEDGSYIFTRRGKLPVRWMAPESFVDGIFTYKTDIWSFGVLLYEIITFGSIPYQMQTNAEVFESVKAGNTLPLPEECTDELKSLMLSCWRGEPTHRPCAAEICVTLRENENMIQPLLSCPALAKIRECDNVDLDLSPTSLKPSTLLKKPFLRQSSSIISVDNIGIISTKKRHSTLSGLSNFSNRHRNQSEVSYRRSTSHRRRSTHSIVDLFSLISPPENHSPPIAPLSLPSPTHSTEQGSSFHFSLDTRHHHCEDSVFHCENKPAMVGWESRARHPSGSTTAATETTSHQVIDENDYLLTTRSCTNISDRSTHSQIPLLQNDETAM